MTFLTIEIYRPKRDLKMILRYLFLLVVPLIIIAAWAI